AHSQSYVLNQAEVEAIGVSSTGPVVQRVSCILRNVVGRTRWHSEPHHARRTTRQGHLRSVARTIAGCAQLTRVTRRITQGARRRPRIPVEGRCLYATTDRAVD